MLGRWNRRSTTAILAALAVGLVVLTTFFVWPGLLLPGCRAYSGPTESINDRTYCYATVHPECVSVPCFANYTEWGFTFHLYVPPNPGFVRVSINVTEPNGTLFSGYVIAGSPPWDFGQLPSAWFAPDNESGVSVANSFENTTFFVLR